MRLISIRQRSLSRWRRQKAARRRQRYRALLSIGVSSWVAVALFVLTGAAPMEILAQNVEVAYEECCRNNPRKDEEKRGSIWTKLDSVWEKVLELRSSGIQVSQCSDEFKEAVLCVGEKEYQDWPYSWWNYEQYRKMRHTWAEFFQSGFQWEDNLILFALARPSKYHNQCS